MDQIPVRQLRNSTPSADPHEGFSIRCINSMLAGGSRAAGLHRHDFYSILAVEQGSGIHQIDLTQYPIHPHSVYVVRPGQVLKVLLEHETTGYMIHFNADFYDPAAHHLLRRASTQNVYSLGHEFYPEINQHLSFLFKEYQNQQAGYVEVIKSCLEIFFIQLIRQQPPDQSTVSAPPYQQDRLDAFLNLLETHVQAQKQVAEYAEMLGLSPYQLNSITKTLLGKTCSEAITEQLVLEAKRYLLGTNNQVKEIAYQLGYDDVSYFIRFFKKHTGQSPEAYRQNSNYIEST